ncbi:MAG: fibronectin type III domain-containing protein [Phycisphaerae bacterium]|nr:fibronectin type III domain-containing protein [Phycisphaerae bacterium]
MARFPKREADIAELANLMAAGLADNTELYPNPPIAPAELAETLSQYHGARDAVVAAAAAYDAAVTAKNEVLARLIGQVKSDIKYAENTAGGQSEKLKTLGWDGRKAKTALAPPGQCRQLEVARQGDSWLLLKWKSPVAGGKPAAYMVMRRQRDNGSFQEVATAMDTQINLVEQPRGLELEYHIRAINKAGQGQPSNTEMVVL